jgi:hypothetical protein
MLHDAAVIAAVADCIEAMAGDLPLVVDPVMLATSGAQLLDPPGVAALTTRLITRATVLTPNLPEAEALLGRRIADADAMVAAAIALRALGTRVVVLKGGHLAGEIVRDVVVEGDASYVLESPRATPRAPDARSPRRSPPAWRKAWRCAPPSSALTITSRRPSPARPALAKGTARSITLTRCAIRSSRNFCRAAFRIYLRRNRFQRRDAG